MLFLTATPFQLGHAELIRVLERFEGVDWKSRRRPELNRAAFKEEIKALGEALNDAQGAALRLDQAWGRLTEEHLRDGEGKPLTVEQWWEMVRAAPGDGAAGQVVAHVESVRGAMRTAEEKLRPWVLRHRKPEYWTKDPSVPRRRIFVGAAIRDDGPGEQGLDVAGMCCSPSCSPAAPSAAGGRRTRPGAVRGRVGVFLRGLFRDAGISDGSGGRTGGAGGGRRRRGGPLVSRSDQ